MSPTRNRALACLLFLAAPFLSDAQSVVEDLSFGHGQTLSPNSFSIPGWNLQGEADHNPQLMSDKVILTPPYPGNKRSSLWSEKKNSMPEWVADFDFRVSGQDRAGGNLQLWYTSDSNLGGQGRSSSIYTAGKFDGLALVIDTHSGGKSTIRGFLNDGSIDFKSNPNVDALAFGHCAYNYRNLGRPSKLRLRATSAGLDVLVDEMPCFRTNKANLPKDYYFGISAASSEISPDSFEIFKFVLRKYTSSQGSKHEAPPAAARGGNTQQEPKAVQEDLGATPEDRLAADFLTSEAQFADLHNRLQMLHHAMNNLFREISQHTKAEEQRYTEILRLLPKQDTLHNLDVRLQHIETITGQLKREVENIDHKTQFDKLHDKLSQTHLGITEHLPSHFKDVISGSAPRMGFFVTTLIIFQLALVVLYVVYKRRRANAPKKYL